MMRSSARHGNYIRKAEEPTRDRIAAKASASAIAVDGNRPGNLSLPDKSAESLSEIEKMTHDDARTASPFNPAPAFPVALNQHLSQGSQATHHSARGAGHDAATSSRKDSNERSHLIERQADKEAEAKGIEEKKEEARAGGLDTEA